MNSGMVICRGLGGGGDKDVDVGRTRRSDSTESG
jgi:hypothetical protein